MTGRVVFLLEEPSMREFLGQWLPRLVPDWRAGEHFLLIPHEGRSDLDRSIPIKLKAWREPGVRFVVVRDNDGADCLALKQRLRERCALGGRDAVVRIVCQELEAWYMADRLALQEAFPEAAASLRRLEKRFPDPDLCLKPSVELERALPDFQKHDAARRMGRRIVPERSRSSSCRLFARTVMALAAASD
jgi:hypothetical protein